MRLLISAAFNAGYIEIIDIESYGIIRIHGWMYPGNQYPNAQLSLAVNGKKVLSTHGTYRTLREDVAQSLGSSDKLLGFIVEFKTTMLAKSLLLAWNDTPIWEIQELSLPFQELSYPPYGMFLDCQEVLHRDTIYGVGPPCEYADPQFITIARTLESPILDFGCGSGALVRELRRFGMQAYGLERDRPAIHKHMDPVVARYISLYDGQFPLPFRDQQFRSVIATEVLEHIEDYEMALSELFRIAQDKVFITVPDMEAIPILAPLYIVPWHMLEATHVNFFTKQSLERCLVPHASKIDFVAISQGMIESNWVPGCLGALCDVNPAPGDSSSSEG